MRLLHLAMGMPEFDRACTDLGHHVDRIDWGRYSYAERQLLLLETCNHDVLFMQLQNPDVVSKTILKAIRDRGTMVINWTGDVRDPIPQHYIDLAPHVDITAFTNLPDVIAMQDLGYDARFLQIGYDPDIYNTEGRITNKRLVVFIGNDYRDRFPLSAARREKVMALHKAFPSEFAAYGKGFGKMLLQGKDATVYKEALIAISLDHFHRTGFHSDRYLRSMACGAYTIDGTALSADALVAIVREALANPRETERLGLLQAEETYKMDRWHNRINTIEQWRTSLS
jgi:hypothetical protein